MARGRLRRRPLPCAAGTGGAPLAALAPARRRGVAPRLRASLGPRLGTRFGTRFGTRLGTACRARVPRERHAPAARVVATDPDLDEGDFQPLPPWQQFRPLPRGNELDRRPGDQLSVWQARMGRFFDYGTLYTMLAGMLISPYLQYYEFGLLVLPVAAGIEALHRQRCPPTPWLVCVLAAAFFLVGGLQPFAIRLGFQPLALLAVGTFGWLCWIGHQVRREHRQV